MRLLKECGIQLYSFSCLKEERHRTETPAKMNATIHGFNNKLKEKCEKNALSLEEYLSTVSNVFY